MDKISFSVNGQSYFLSGTDVRQGTTLNTYLRDHLNLYGTKWMCQEGGCGACVVTVRHLNPITKEKEVSAVNSCLVDILSCHNWEITTIEGVGNAVQGYHPLQTRLATFNGTQCGYCTPGWIMNMYSLYKSSGGRLNMREIENSFGGNICRCTGYRPILDAFKSFATDVGKKLPEIQDMEDLHQMKCVNKLRKCSLDQTLDDDWCLIENPEEPMLRLQSASSRWYKVYRVEDVFKLLAREGLVSYRFIAGNTGKGVYPIKVEPQVYIDISSINTLKEVIRAENLILGAGLSLSDMMRECMAHFKSNQDFSYLEQFYKHLELVAHVPVRNIGTIGGNLAMKNSHNDFPSDVYILLETVGAMVTILDKDLRKTEVKMENFLKLDLRDKLILNIKLPPLSTSNIIRTYKIMPRAQNAHAIVNAGFLFKMESQVVTCCRIIFSNLGLKPTRAVNTEKLLIGAEISDSTLQKALAKLEEEIVAVDMPPEPSKYCRKTIALGLFYQAVLSISPSVNLRFKSGGSPFDRPISSGSQLFDTDKSIWPLNQPVQKLEALVQCSGEAAYSCDGNAPREVHLVFVLSDVPVAEVKNIDPEEVLKLDGVIAFYSAKDIPGKNSFTPFVSSEDIQEQLFATKVLYHGQPLGVVVAETRELAIKAAEMVKVEYEDVKEPLLTVEDVLNSPEKNKRTRKDVSVVALERGGQADYVITGSYTIPGQYHYTMETQCCIAEPKANTIVLKSATQWMDAVQTAVAQTLDLPANSVEVNVERVGGAYGGKASRSALIACACALAAHKLRRPASLRMPLVHNMRALGKRAPCLFQYELGVDSNGRIQSLQMSFYTDCGCSYGETSAATIADTIRNVYTSTWFSISGYSVRTDMAANVWCRAPGTTEGTAIMEHIMERIAHTTGLDPTEVRIANLAAKNSPLEEIIISFKNETNYEDRRSEIAQYNNKNAWRKRCIKLCIMSYPIEYYGNFSATVTIYHTDGSVVIGHAGVEMGQGINTKAAQVCAYALGIPLKKVSVRGADSFVSPNCMASSGSITSESVSFSILKACKELLDRLEPARRQLPNPTWEDIVRKSHENGVNLQASAMTSPEKELQGYDAYGVCAAEVILDVATGRYQLLRLDLMEDTGRSLSPQLDVGQIEGAFVMGLGLWTSERLLYSNSGRLLTDRTWSYKPPGALDIPADFRISFRRNSVNRAGVLRSKATGEPALVLSVAVTFAIHGAILEARKEFGYVDTEWLHVDNRVIGPNFPNQLGNNSDNLTTDNPYTVENIITAIAPRIEKYKLN